MKYILASLLSLMPLTSKADAIYLGGWSKHFGGSVDNDGYELNEKHDMVAVEYDNIIAGTFINSYHKRGYLLGYQYNLIEEKYANLDIMAGGLNGYLEGQFDFLRVGDVNGFVSFSLEANTPYIKPAVMLFGTAFILTFKYEF